MLTCWPVRPAHPAERQPDCLLGSGPTAERMRDAAWQIGETIVARGERWTIRETAAWPECVLLRLAGAATVRTRSILVPFDRPRRAPRRQRIRVVRPRRALHELRALDLSLRPRGGADAAASTTIRLLPHQIEPLLAVLRYGSTRVLLADAVGLGKTIQAGLILHELAAGSETFRAIVLVPAGLREQWANELSSHFGIRSIQADAAWLQRGIRERPPEVNPWAFPGVHIVSLDFAKRPEVLRSLEDVRWDVLVLDEAHLATTATGRRAAADAVARHAARVILLTATPHAGDAGQFTALCGLGRVDPHEPPVVMFRRSHSDVGAHTARRSVMLRVRQTPAERRMHALLEGYTQGVWREASRRRDAQARLAAIVLRKRALSSAASLAASVSRRMDLLASGERPEATQLALPLGDEGPLDDAVADHVLAARGLADPERELRWLASIAEWARRASRRESKTARLLALLRRVREPIIVFTEYRDTLIRLEHIIKATGRPLAVLHGGIDAADRSRIQRAFNAGGTCLLATDAAAEGLNLHHHCRIVLHYELPWSPSRIEQRAGRVDRLGQAKRVHEIALVAAGTSERLVLAPLAVRAARARMSGERLAPLLDALTEEAVAALVMRSGDPQPEPAPSVTVRTMDLAGEAAVEVARLELQRQWTSVTGRARVRPSRAGAIASCVPAPPAQGGSAVPAVVVVFACILRDADGRDVHAEPIALRLEGDWPSRTADPGTALRAIADSVQAGLHAGDRAVCSVLDPLLERIADRIVAQHLASRVEPVRREHALLRVRTDAARQLVQAGLFDQRATREGVRISRHAARQLYESTARAAALERHEQLTAHATLRAVLVYAGGRRRG